MDRSRESLSRSCPPPVEGHRLQHQALGATLVGTLGVGEAGQGGGWEDIRDISVPLPQPHREPKTTLKNAVYLQPKATQTAVTEGTAYPRA